MACVANFPILLVTYRAHVAGPLDCFEVVDTLFSATLPDERDILAVSAIAGMITGDESESITYTVGSYDSQRYSC